MNSSSSSPPRWLAFAGLTLIAAMSCGPLLLEQRPVVFLPPLAQSWGVRATVLVLMAGVLVVGAVCSRTGWRMVLFALLAALMVFVHFRLVETAPRRGGYRGQILDLQRYWYHHILNGPRLDIVGERFAPHDFRPLPYGFVRTLEFVTRDWLFSCLAYRWFFSTGVLWASFEFAARFLGPGRAWLAVVVIVMLYPLSVMYYIGQLTDPLSHFLFVLSLIWIVEDRWLALAVALGLGVMAKETTVILVPAYYFCYWRKGLPALGKTAVLGLTCVAAFLAVRLPLGWRPGLNTLNGTTELMIASNLGLPVCSVSPLRRRKSLVPRPELSASAGILRPFPPVAGVELAADRPPAAPADTHPRTGGVR